MARHIPTRFVDKLHEVQIVLEVARTEAGRHFDFGREVLPGVRVVRVEVHGEPIAFSLWDYDKDVVAICGDASYPAARALLAIDREQAEELRRRDVVVDLSQFRRSDATPGLYYALFDHVSPRHLHKVLHTLVPQLEPHDARKLVA